MKSEDFVISFDSAVKPISKHLRALLLCLDSTVKVQCNEIRLRKNKPLVLVKNNKCFFLHNDGSVGSNNINTYICSEDELSDTFMRMCDYSIHSYSEDIKEGYVTIDGGHRVGVVGTASRDVNNNIISVRDISCLNIRIAKKITGCSDEIYSCLFRKELQSVIIAGSPSSGKTTVLRDLVRNISGNGYKICLVDERKEVSLKSTVFSADIGINTDVYCGYPKISAINMALRTMSPHIIALDEVCEDSELYAIKKAANCGVKMLVTVHASSYVELLTRPQIRALINTYAFDKVVLLKGADNPGKVSEIFNIQELRDEIYRCNVGLDMYCDDRTFDLCQVKKKAQIS